LHWIAAKVTFDSQNPAQTAELIADAFDAIGISGVVVDDPLLDPVEGWGSDAVPLPVNPAVTGYLPGDARYERLRFELEQAISDLATRHPLQYAIEYRQIDEQAWAESWKAFFKPQPITSRLVVKPTWCDYVPEPGQQVIELDPGMAFGTGTHPTTAMCVHLLEQHLRPGDTLLDVGTGSGILLIAAAKLGAGRLTGVDLDPTAITVARANLVQNAIGADRYELICGHLIEAVSGTYDIVVANILADVVVELLDGVAAVLKPGGRFICSGIIHAQKEMVGRAMADHGFSRVAVTELGEWLAFAGEKR
jgi:ribosomal protein L11 methyltransferase